MQLTGNMQIGAKQVNGGAPSFHAIDPRTGDQLEPLYGTASIDDVNVVCALASEAFDAFREAPLEDRARFLEAIADQILALGDHLIERAMAETGLPRGRLEGERGRTVGQLRLFASVLREGSFLDIRIDPAQPERKPLPRVDLRLRHIGLGPVAVFGASNFPLAFSVAGGDTASALAAGCPVVVKGHPAHPGTSELVARAVQAAVQQCSLPEGVFSLLTGITNEIGGALVAHPAIKAVGFTGSRRGGMALMAISAARAEPIPVYAEMSSINPVLLMPRALASRGESIGRSFVGSLTLGSGQFCTNPGLVLAIVGAGLDEFLAGAASALTEAAAQTMLTPAICAAYRDGVARMASEAEPVARGLNSTGPNQGEAVLFSIDATQFLASHNLRAENFGASSLLVRCVDATELRHVLETLEGQLTTTLQIDDEDTDLVRSLLPVLERKAGRILVNGWPTGVEVAPAMVHGGPVPSTSDGRSTSVGTLAIKRFLRPVCFQDFPSHLLPSVLRDGNPLGLWRQIDGTFSQA